MNCPDLPPATLLPLLSGEGSPSELSLSEEIVFSSPVAEYRGRADVVHLLECIARVLSGLAATSEGSDGASRLTMLTARVGELPIDGVLREHHDASGRLTHATLFLRPYASLRVAIHQMAALLADDPLPSSR